MTMVACSSKPEINYPYIHIDKKMEEGNNTMELYTIQKTIDIDTLKMFCLDKKTKFSGGTFYYIVFFDSKENAVFPNNPFTAFYGMDEEPQKHIKAYYEYNSVNGFSELKVYDLNSWESKPKIIKL